jgi:ActR/RegA family two-component response regulator
VTLFLAHGPDVCAVDVGPGCTSGLTALRWIVGLDPDARVIACTNAGFGVNTVAAVRAGASHVVTTLRRLDTVLETLDPRVAR